MPNFYEISPTHDTLVLHDGKGSATFGVRYVGNRRVEARAMAVPMEGAEDGWLNVESPEPREMQPGQTQTFKVTVKVPQGTSPGRYGLRLDLVSVDNPDEEYDRGPLITFQVEPSEAPEPSPAFPWWKVIVAALLLVLVIGIIVWWASRETDPGDVIIDPINNNDDPIIDDPDINNDEEEDVFIPPPPPDPSPPPSDPPPPDRPPPTHPDDPDRPDPVQP